MNTKTTLNISMRQPPTSIDPLDFDKLSNQIATSSVNATLVSTLENGKYTPSIAKKWRTENNFKDWYFEIDNLWTFSNGQPVTVENVLQSFKRIIFLKSQTRSNSGLLEYLIDYNIKKNSINFDSNGIFVKDNILVLKFNRPMPDVLEKISFGLYAIAHPDSYNEKGIWKNVKAGVTSGKYSISVWNKDVLILKNRITNINAFDIAEVVFNFSKDAKVILNSDIAFRDKNSLLFDSSWKFASSIKDSSIVYVKVMKWKDGKSIWSDRDFRIKIRDLFYRELEKSGVDLSYSFFPLHISGIKKIQKSDIADKELKKITKLVLPPFMLGVKSDANKNVKDLGDKYKEAFERLCNNSNLRFEYIDYPENESDEESLYDFQFLGTGINADDPNDDIKFMFLSKHGINLPDEDGKIKQVLANNTLDIQKINQEIWNQGIIWPILFYSQGFWEKESSGIDFSKVNLNKLAIDFQFLKWK